LERIKAIVLAAGKGTRLQTEANDAPKVMRTVCGKPLLRYVLDALPFISEEDIVIVVGYKKEKIIDSFPGYIYMEQAGQLGTGHAVMAAEAAFSGYGGAVLVCYGDMPLIKRETYESLVMAHFSEKNDCTILTGESAVPLPYGRVVRDENDRFSRVIEHKDCTEEQRKITELNSGVYVFDAPLLFRALKSIRPDNRQGEYYLTDVPAILSAGGARVGLLKRDLGDEIIGVNTPLELAQVEERLTRGTPRPQKK